MRANQAVHRVRDHGPRLGCLAERVLRVVRTAAEWPHHDRRGVAEQIRRFHRRVAGRMARRDHRELRAAGPARRPQAGGAPDAARPGCGASAVANGAARRGASPAPGPRPIWCSGSLSPAARISCGWPISPTSRPRPACCIWPWCSTSGVVASSAGPWRRICGPRGAGRLGYGHRAAAARRRHPSLGSGLPIHRRRLWAALSRAGHPASMGSVGDCYDDALERFAKAPAATLETAKRFPQLPQGGISAP